MYELLSRPYSPNVVLQLSAVLQENRFESNQEVAVETEVYFEVQGISFIGAYKTSCTPKPRLLIECNE